MVNPGRFDQPVRLERPARTRNEFGEAATENWVLVAEVWAQAILPSARDLAKESALGSRAIGERTCQFRLRWPLDVRDQDRLVWENENYGIEGIVIDRRGGEVLLTGVFRAGTDGR